VTETLSEADPPAVGRGPLTVWEIRAATDLASVRAAMCEQAEAHLEDTGAPGPSGGPLLASGPERLGLVFSELATNALRHAIGPITAALARSATGWLVTVSDGVPDTAPVVMTAARYRPGGHGLRLVSRLSRRVGWYRDRDVKHVWADVPDVAPAPLLDALSAPS
jgi:hypothetical protein